MMRRRSMLGYWREMLEKVQTVGKIRRPGTAQKTAIVQRKPVPLPAPMSMLGRAIKP